MHGKDIIHWAHFLALYILVSKELGKEGSLAQKKVIDVGEDRLANYPNLIITYGMHELNHHITPYPTHIDKYYFK